MIEDIKIKEKDTIDVGKEAKINFEMDHIIVPTNMTFFHDETNNSGKLYLDVSKDCCYNDENAIKNDFIIGGIAYENDKEPPNFQDLIKKLNLENSNELKSDMFFRTDDFLYDLGYERIIVFLKWLNENENIYTHYYCLNNLYYSMLDFLQSLDYSDSKYDDLELKDAFYHCIKDDYRNFKKYTNTLIKYNYPNIGNEKISSFCFDVISIINNEDSPKIKEIIRLINKTKKTPHNMLYLTNNESNILIDDYYLNYIEKMINFPYCIHIFDQESKIERKLSDVTLLCDGKRYENYSFINSKEEIGIQISDVFIGILNHYFLFIDDISKQNGDYIDRLAKSIKSDQLENLLILNNLIDRSILKCPKMIFQTIPMSIVDNRGLFLEYLKYIKDTNSQKNYEISEFAKAFDMKLKTDKTIIERLKKQYELNWKEKLPKLYFKHMWRYDCDDVTEYLYYISPKCKMKGSIVHKRNLEDPQCIYSVSVEYKRHMTTLDLSVGSIVMNLDLEKIMRENGITFYDTSIKLEKK